MIARRGYRVGIIDTDIQSPGVHVLFGLDEQRIRATLNDYLWSRCAMEEAAHDVTPEFNGSARPSGGRDPAVFVIPSSIKSEDIARILREGYDIARLNDGIYEMGLRLKLDYVLIDTHPGVNEETLLSIAMSDMLIVVLRPDRQDYLGTAVTVDLARKLDVANMLLLVNKVPSGMDASALREQVESTYAVPAGAVLPLCDEMVFLGSAGLFVIRHPSHELSGLIGDLADRILLECAPSDPQLSESSR
jgi:MinD-like ATPase involved in chromosome partitioning or flagellar assembly